MKPQFLQVATPVNHSFSVRQDLIPINCRWHCHKDVELIYFHRGSGTQFVGDSIRRFSAGDVVLVGSNLPHYWHFDRDGKGQSTDSIPQLPYSTVVHFTEDFWGRQFLSLPENKPVNDVLHKAQRGIMLTGEIGQQVAKQMETLLYLEGTHRLIALLNCLLSANSCEETSLLSSIGFQYDASEAENERLHTIYQYTLHHFHDKISLQEIASLAGLAPNSFCRYFKYRTGRSFSHFLIEIRIGQACKLLIDNRLPLKQICYECGFNNFTCFFKKFKLITGLSPLAYQRAHLK